MGRSKTSRRNNDRYVHTLRFWINPRNQTTTYGVTAANHEHRSLIRETLLGGNNQSEKLWNLVNNPAASYSMDISIFGNTETADGTHLHTYRQIVSTPASFGGNPIWTTIHDTIDNLKTIRIDIGDPGYIETTNRLIINNVIVKIYEETYRGGGSRKTAPESFQITRQHYARDAKVCLNYGDLRGEDPNANNNCAFRALYDQLPNEESRKWFKRNFNLRTIRNEFNLPPKCKISPQELVAICESRKMYVEVVIVTGKDWETATWTSIECDKNVCEDLRLRRVILHTDISHYFVGTIGGSAGATGDYLCPICDERVPIKDTLRHELCHKLVGNDRVAFDIPNGALKPNEGETEEEHSERYMNTYVKVFKDFFDDEDPTKILGVMGPGGCGKSYVLKHLKSTYPEINLMCMCKTGVAAQNIGGITYDSFILKLRSMKESDLPELIIIDEISFIDQPSFDKLDKLLREKSGVSEVMGGIKTIVMGDFLQSPPPGNEPSCLFSTNFSDHVVSVPMLWGFRYKNDMEFYKLLLQLRSSYVPINTFLDAGFGMTTVSEWIHNYAPEERPTMLVTGHVLRRTLEAKARAYDLAREHVEEEHITINIKKIEPGTEGVLLSAKEQRLCGSTKGRVIQNVDHPGPNANFVMPLSSSEFSCEINTDKHSFYTNERLMVLKNKCDDQGILMNGVEVTFFGIQNIDGNEVMLVKTKDNVLCSIPKVVRGCKHDGSFYICEGFPVQSALISTITKCQGKTYSSIVVYIPKTNQRIHIQHSYYVAISRCVSSKTVSFMIEDQHYNTVREGLKFVHNRLYHARKGKKPLIELNEVMVKVMKYSENGGLLKLCPALDTFLDVRTSSIFPSSSNATYWNPTVPAKVDTIELQRSMLTSNSIFYDIETCAQIGFENHPTHFNENDDLIYHENNMRHDQTVWLFSFLHIRESKIIWMKDEVNNATNPRDKDLLRLLATLQDPDTGIVHIQLERDSDGGDYCQFQFVRYMLYEAQRLEAYKLQKLKQQRRSHRNAKLSRYDRLPCTLIGFNSDSFDSKSVLNALESERIKDFMPANFQQNIIRNSGTAITRLSIVTDKWYNIGELIATHDLFRYMGCIYGLKDTHNSLITKPYGSDRTKLEAFVDSYTHDTTLIRNICKHTASGKGEFPHLLTQQKGYKVTLSKEIKTYAIKYYPEQMQCGVQDLESRRFSIYHKAREYMNGDIYCLVGAYFAANEAIAHDLGLPILSLNTAQQKTTANYLYTGSHIQGLIYELKTDKFGERTTFSTKYSLPNAMAQHMIDQATYGGKTTPRVDEWNERDGYGTYNQVDESGMYSDAQEKCNYPYGPHHFKTDDSYCEWVRRSYNHMRSGDCMRDPHNTEFPFMYIAEVTIKLPSLCIDPTLPFRDEDKQLNWGIANEGTHDGYRRQYLTSVHLGSLKNIGGELVKVHSVLFWEKYGRVYHKYMIKLNEIKYTTKDAVIKLMAKLDANANYGAALKKDNITYTTTYTTDSEYNEICKKLDPLKGFYRRELPNGKIIIQGELRADNRETSSRPTYLGAFVLSHSQFKLNNLEIVGFGPTFVPKTISDAREGLITQPTYGDTDSLYLHDTHITRLLEHAQTPGGVNYLYDQTEMVDQSKPTKDELVSKLGKYCDEVANDNGCGHLVNYRNGVYTTVIEFAAGGPKAYTCAYRMPNGQTVYKNSIKGVKKGSKIATVTSSQDRKRALQDTELRFNKKCKLVHDETYAAITQDSTYLASFAPRVIKNFGMTPQYHEKTKDKDGMVYDRVPNTYSTANLNRDVLKNFTTRRRKLTPQEVGILELNQYDANRIRVPTGWNWDGALFDLI